MYSGRSVEPLVGGTPGDMRLIRSCNNERGREEREEREVNLELRV